MLRCMSIRHVRGTEDAYRFDRYTPGRLVDTMLAHLQLRDVRALTDLPNPQLAQLRLFLKGVLVKPTISKMRARPITDLVREAGMQEFDKDNERWTVAVMHRRTCRTHITNECTF